MTEIQVNSAAAGVGGQRVFSQWSEFLLQFCEGVKAALFYIYIDNNDFRCCSSHHSQIIGVGFPKGSQRVLPVVKLFPTSDRVFGGPFALESFAGAIAVPHRVNWNTAPAKILEVFQCCISRCHALAPKASEYYRFAEISAATSTFLALGRGGEAVRVGRTGNRAQRCEVHSVTCFLQVPAE